MRDAAKEARWARFLFNYVRGDMDRTPEYYAELRRLFELEEKAVEIQKRIADSNPQCPECTEAERNSGRAWVTIHVVVDHDRIVVHGGCLLGHKWTEVQA